MNIIGKLDKYSQPCKFDLVLITIVAFFGFFVWMICAISMLWMGITEGNVFAFVIGAIGLYIAKLYYVVGRIIQNTKAK